MGTQPGGQSSSQASQPPHRLSPMEVDRLVGRQRGRLGPRGLRSCGSMGVVAWRWVAGDRTCCRRAWGRSQLGWAQHRHQSVRWSSLSSGQVSACTKFTHVGASLACVARGAHDAESIKRTYTLQAVSIPMDSPACNPGSSNAETGCQLPGPLSSRLRGPRAAARDARPDHRGRRRVK